MICTAHRKTGEPCKSQAVTGWNVCYKHGAGGGRPVTTGKNVGTNSLKKRMQEYKDNPELLTLNTGLEATQSMLDLLTDRIVEEMGKETLNLDVMIKLVESVNNCANALYNGHKSIASIEHSNVLTAKEYASFSEGIKYAVKELNQRYGDAGEYMIRCFESYSVLKNSIKAIEE